MKKLLLIALVTLGVALNAQKQYLLYKEYQDYDTTVLAYTPVSNVVMPCEIDFDTSLITIGDKQTSYTTFKLQNFNIANNCLVYQCENKELKIPCVIVIYVYGEYRYLEVVYTTKNKFKYRVKTDESLSLNKN